MDKRPGRARRALARLSMEEIRRRVEAHGLGFALEGVRMIWWDTLQKREREGVIHAVSDHGVLFRCEGRFRWVELELLRAIIS